MLTAVTLTQPFVHAGELDGSSIPATSLSTADTGFGVSPGLAMPQSSPAAPSVNAGSTSDLQLDLKPRSAGLDFKERALGRESPQLPSRLTHPGATGGAVATGQLLPAAGYVRGETDTADNRGRLLALWLSPESIEFVRQHRRWVVAGGLAVIGLVWAASAMVDRRR